MAGMTRGEFAKQLAIKMGYDGSAGASGFSDTAGTSYDPYVSYLKSQGVTTGTSGSTFDPFAEITREQAATMVGRAYNITSNTSAGYRDTTAGHYSEQYLNGLKEAGVFTGLPGSDVGTGLAFGIGGAFTWAHWDAVDSKLDTFLGTSGTDTPPPVVADNPDTVGDASSGGDGGADTEGITLQDSFKWAEAYINQYFDLPGMGDWVKTMVTKYGASLNADIIEVELYDTNQFKERFGEVMQGRKDAGLNAVSPGQILDYENSVRQIMRASGMPEGFYDDLDDIHKLMVADLSPAELEERIQVGFERVAYAPLEVRAAYADFYGVQGDEALAAYILDPELAVPLLEKQVLNAEIAGTGRQFDIGISKQRAEQLSGIGVDQRMAFSGFSKLSALAPVFQETFGGEGRDLDIEDEGVDAVLMGQGEEASMIERRIQTRTAQFSGGGGAAVTNEGVIGLGSAR